MSINVKSRNYNLSGTGEQTIKTNISTHMFNVRGLTKLTLLGNVNVSGDIVCQDGLCTLVIDPSKVDVTGEVIGFQSIESIPAPPPTCRRSCCSAGNNQDKSPKQCPVCECVKSEVIHVNWHGELCCFDCSCDD